jgi:hypothetical protein
MGSVALYTPEVKMLWSPVPPSLRSPKLWNDSSKHVGLCMQFTLEQNQG